MCDIKVSIIGLGFVGSAIHKSFNLKGFKNNINLFTYDKFKDDGIGNLNI